MIVPALARTCAVQVPQVAARGAEEGTGRGSGAATVRPGLQKSAVGAAGGEGGAGRSGAGTEGPHIYVVGRYLRRARARLVRGEGRGVSD